MTVAPHLIGRASVSRRQPSWRFALFGAVR
jgi:hypothetical protein